ncbi:transcription factor bzip [Colletotrichum incanum]|uniref:Transcription factor bzip n=1 Tax=Colletotrichum incanum TaxID=1573173 RepID=A0A167DPX8_COLIC|nr:transcription factor bzip [Colletotrichum incanum]
MSKGLFSVLLALLQTCSNSYNNYYNYNNSSKIPFRGFEKQTKMSHKIFQIFNPGGPKEDPVNTRRAQLRNAQRPYRDRKDKYTKALEQEVGQITANETELMTRSRHGIIIPPTLGKNTNDETSNDHHRRQIISIIDNVISLVQFGISRHNAIPTLTRTPAEVHLPFQTGNMSNLNKNKRSARYRSRMCELDPTLVGMEFVLTTTGSKAHAWDISTVIQATLTSPQVTL